MKKLTLSLSFIALSTAYAVYLHYFATPADITAQALPTNETTTTSPAPVIATQPTVIKGGEDNNEEEGGVVTKPAPITPPPTPTPTPAPAPAPAPKPKPTGQYADGTYTGSGADAYYGIIQVKATIQGGRIADVVFLQYPNDRSTSRRINGQAMPILKSEAIRAQNANVDIVSGATDSSMAFQQSLADALAQAKP